MADAPAYDGGTRLVHLLLALSGVAAVVSGQFADDYRRGSHPGFDVHQWLGLAMAAALAVRGLCGIAGPRAMRFSRWRAEHPGLPGVVQALGLAAFLWMAASGALLFAFLEPGTRAAGWLRLVKELHEGGQFAVLAYLALHVGAVILHGFLGDPVWRRMFVLRRRP